MKRIVIASGVGLWCYATSVLLPVVPWAAVAVFIAGGVGVLLAIDSREIDK